jgi:NAD(P)H dehydrogenase (quinone)
VFGALHGKFAGVFVSTAAPWSGQEAIATSSLSTLATHGITYVPLECKDEFKHLQNL